MALVFAIRGDAAERLMINFNWRFQQGDFPEAIEANFDVSKWHRVNLPHDWSITSVPAAEASSGGAGGFYATGIGWYRYAFPTLPEWNGKRVSIHFEGVYQNTEVWINGRKLGTHHYGYTPFQFDLTEFLRAEGTNVLAVRVDNSQQPNSRWYSGSGIYRPVWLLISNPVHLESDRSFAVLEELNDNVANVAIHSSIRNQEKFQQELLFRAVVLDSEGNELVSQSSSVSVEADDTDEADSIVQIKDPALWSPETPYLYKVCLQLQSGGEVLDETAFPLGLRQVKVSAAKGLLINGQPVLLCGANVHHDHGVLGAASYPAAERRRVKVLKEAGFNAVRTSHNPPSVAFLDACDELGMLVIDEAFDGWADEKTEYDYAQVFESDWKQDLSAMVERDRNHPSVIMWSIGNEVYERGKPEGAELARKMSAVVRELDSSRPVTAGINGLGSSEKWPNLDPFFQPLDVAGYNYELHRRSEDHQRLPTRVMMSTESYPTDVFASWKAVRDYPYVIGDFVWSGIDYLGEAGIGRVFEPQENLLPHWEGNHFPWHGAICGDIDLTGWRKPLSHYRQIVWDRGEKLYAAVQIPRTDGKKLQKSPWSQEPAVASWTWPGWEDKELTLEVYSRYPKVRVMLNGKLVEEQPTGEAEQFRTVFRIPYQPGVLSVVGLEESRPGESIQLQTGQEPAQIRLIADRAKLMADGQDLSFITVEVMDSQGTWCPTAGNTLRYQIRGPGEILGVGSSDLTSLHSYQALTQPVFEGRALLVIRSDTEPGEIELIAEGAGLKSGKLSIATSSP